MNGSEARSTGRWCAPALLVVLTVPNLAAGRLAAKCTFDVVSARFISFSNFYTAGALLAAVVATIVAVTWLSILAWNGRPPRRIRLIVAYGLACAAL